MNTGAVKPITDGIREANEMAGDGAGRQQGDGSDAFHLQASIALLDDLPCLSSRLRRLVEATDRVAGIALLDDLLRLYLRRRRRRRRPVVAIRLALRDRTHCSPCAEHRL